MTVPARADGGPSRDRGLQAERTALSWNRASLGLTVVGLLVTRELSGLGFAPTLLWLVVTAVTAALVQRTARVRYRRAVDALAGSPGADPPPLLLLCAAVGVQAAGAVFGLLR